MTSTNIFSGIKEGRNSSRVLRPPGGGHSDIFGVNTPPEEPQPKKISPRNISSIVEGTNQMPLSPDKKSDVKVVKENEKLQQQEAPQPSNPAGQRVRAPPGGFSSGLW